MDNKYRHIGGALYSEKSQQFSFVYYYLLAGIMLLVAVFLFLPKVAAS